MYSAIEHLIHHLDVRSITEERRTTLEPLIEFIRKTTDLKEDVLLNFICTHNSRRSHLSQIWAQVMATYFGCRNVSAYSGGTEATAMFPQVVETLKAQGFQIMVISKGINPVYAIKYSENTPPIIGFSKPYDHFFNPRSRFAAIMTCSQADAGCPFISGTEYRIPITYDDPKIFDGTPQEAEKYTERSVQIATELFYVFSKMKQT